MRKNKTRALCGILCAGVIGFTSQATFANGNSCGKETVRAEISMAADRAVSTVKDMGLGGFVGLKVIENIEKWQLTAYENNPNIVEAIAAGNSGKARLSDLQAGSLAGYFNISVGKTPNGQVLEYTNTESGGGTNDVDFRFVQDNTAVTDWSGAKELWVYADFSAYEADEPKLRVSFEEKDTGTGARKSWRAKGGVSYIADGTDTRITASLWDNRVVLPKHFKGWVCWTLDESSLERYYANGALSAGLELKHVQQFQIGAWNDNFSVGTSFSLDKFSIVGNVDGEALPCAVGGTDGYTIKEVWSLDGLSPNSYDGSMMAWYGEFAGKHLTGLALSYSAERSEALYEAGKKLADDLIDAQGEDGYLGRFYGDKRYAQNDDNWDVWANYHCIYGLYRWYKVSGEKKYLDAACKGLDCIANTFGREGDYYGSFGQEMNMAISHAFICLYSETGKIEYLLIAEHIVLDNWQDYGDWLNNSESGKDFYRSSHPRWEALHTISTLGGLYESTGNIRYYNALEQIWESILSTDVHNDGGFSSGEGACGDPYSTGAVESCCTVAWMALSTEFLQISKRSDVADELELSYMNAMLGAVTDNGKYITYDTPMNGTKIPATTTLAFQYNGGSPDFSCCQANLARGVGQISDWAVLTDNDTVYLNYYGDSTIEATTPSGKKIVFDQTTEYPSDGKIRIEIKTEETEPFYLALRIPGWSNSSSVKVNGELKNGVFAGSYYSENRKWKDGDIIELSLDMGLHYQLGHNHYEGYTSIYTGPILLTLDEGYAAGEVKFGFESADIENSAFVKEDGRLVAVRSYTSSGVPVMLVDFAGAGRNGKYYASWLKINHTDEQKRLLDSSEKVWQNTLTHSVYFDPKSVAVSKKSGVSAGEETVLLVRGGKTPVVYAEGRVLELKKTGDGRFAFIMPQCDVYVTTN